IALGEISNQDLALSAEVYLHEDGHANAHYGSMGNIEGATNLDIACGPDPKNPADCCTTSKGCPGALNEAHADVHAGIIFPDDTAIGSTVVNATGGLVECGFPSSIDANANLTAIQAYNVNSGAGVCPVSVKGEIHVLGRVYASVWWEVRRATANKSEIET